MPNHEATRPKSQPPIRGRSPASQPAAVSNFPSPRAASKRLRPVADWAAEFGGEFVAREAAFALVVAVDTGAAAGVDSRSRSSSFVTHGGGLLIQDSRRSVRRVA